jgi:hypothetical protein
MAIRREPRLEFRDYRLLLHDHRSQRLNLRKQRANQGILFIAIESGEIRQRRQTSSSHRRKSTRT